MFNVLLYHATQIPHLLMLIAIMYIYMLGIGSGGGDGNQKDHYHEVTCTIGLQDHCRRDYGIDDRCFIECDEAAREEDLHLHCFFLQPKYHEG